MMPRSLRSLLAVCALSCAFFAFADAPSGYYSSLNGKKEGELKTAVHNLIRNFTLISSYSDLPKYFQTTDVYPEAYNGRTRWWEMYSDDILYAPSFSGLNREHSFPKSWWGGSTSVSAYVDLNHLYPSERNANSAKNNYPLGTVNRDQAIKFDNGVSTVGYPVNGQGGNASFVFEPADEYKGDFARTYFYMVTCYQDLTWKYTYMVSQNLYPTLNAWSIALLLKWHREDPVSQKELDRNDAVYSFQNNRNPFIDMPELAEYIWGTKVGEAFTPGNVTIVTGDPELFAPSKGMEINLGQIALGNKTTTRLYFHGENLQVSIDVQLYSGNSKMFSVGTTAIPAASICSDDGYWLNITYTPTEIGEHQSKVLFSGEFGSRAVTIYGECLEVPSLSACTATAPSDIQSDRYTANWTFPENEEIDNFVITRTRYVGTEVITEELIADEPDCTSLEIPDFNTSDRESYSVQSVRLGHRSPMSNVIFVDHSGLNGIELEEPLIIRVFDGFIRFICSRPQTNCRLYDISGRLVLELPSVEQDMDVQLPYGVYLIVTDQHHTPVKVAVR